MADEFRKTMDKLAGKGGRHCYCCGLDKPGKRRARRILNQKWRKKFRNFEKYLFDEQIDLDPKIQQAINENFWDLV